MPAGMPYFAWIDPGETIFLPEHLRWDEQVFSFTLQQSEGDPASLTLVVRRPMNEAGTAIGLLGPGRKIWAWFAFDCGPGLVMFRGRLVGVPTSIFEEKVTLEFVARPIDLVAQKAALAASLRVLPYYDPAVLDPARRTDPEVVLEGYSAVWHYDRETHVLSVSDEIDGEDGLVEFDGASEAGKVLYDGLGLTLTSGPLTRVDVNAEFTWTQQGQGSVDLTRYLISHWPGHGPNYITSFTFTADNWPKPGATLGDGWIAADATAVSGWGDYQTETKTGGSTLKVNFPDTSWFGPSSQTTTYTDIRTIFVNEPPGSAYYPGPIKDEITMKHQPAKPANMAHRPMSPPTPATGRKHRRAGAELHRADAGRRLYGKPPMHRARDVLALCRRAARSDRSRGRRGAAHRRREIGQFERGDRRRRADRRSGAAVLHRYRARQRSLEHLIALARAHLLQRARVVEIAFAPKLERMPEITLRKNVFLAEPRIGEAVGKVIGYTLALDGRDGRVHCEVRIGCAIGRGGSAVAAGGEPTYCEEAYCGADYQQYTGRTVLFDTSVGYQPPNADPNDDGLNLLGALSAEDIIDTPLVVENPASRQAESYDSRAEVNPAKEANRRISQGSSDQGNVQAQEHDARVYQPL